MGEQTETQDAVLKRIAQSSVGLLVNVPADDGKGAFEPAGSGVMCRLPSSEIVIVTAAHVANYVMQHSWAAMYGIPSPNPNLRPVEFHTDLTGVISYGGTNTVSFGPDIAILKPPPDCAATLANSRVVYDIKKRIENPPNRLMPDVVLVGLPSTAFSKIVSVKDMARRDEHTLMVVSGTKSKAETDNDGFDRFEFRPEHVNGLKPWTYEGVSGGGVWAFDGDDPNELPRLVGIAYYQSDEDEAGQRIVYCAGPKAIYEKVLKEANDRWS